MMNTQRIAKGSFLLGLIGLVMGCVVTPNEGAYDHEHHRYYHERSWHDCGERDEHCH
jgi:hypothetical protein